jgi:hypothetical protein
LRHKDLVIKAIIFGISFYFLEVLVYLSAMATGPGQTSRKILGMVSLHDLAGIITFPLVHLAAKHDLSWLGRIALTLNAVLWAAGFFCMLALLNRQRGSSFWQDDQPPAP